MAEGAAREPDALTQTVVTAGGYPYFLPEHGSTAWNLAVGPLITRHDAASAELLGQAKPDAGFFAGRWVRATPSERDYLTSMAPDHRRPSQSSDVATRLSRTPSAMGPARAGRISKGLILAPQHGQIVYTVPGMAEFITQRAT